MSEVQKDLIYDVGMHDGQDTDFYLKKGFRVVSIEANPGLCADARLRFAEELKSGQLVIEEVAIFDTVGEATFYVNQTNSKWSSLFVEWGERGKGATEIRVPTTLFENIIAKHGIPYYLKIDIEGGDNLVLDALRRLPAAPPYVSVEGGSEPMLLQMKNAGYTEFAVVNQQYVPHIKCPNPATEGKFVDHAFPMGASGLFGRELREQWITYDQVVEERNAFKKIIDEIKVKYPGSPSQQRHARANLGWFDVHGRIT